MIEAIIAGIAVFILFVTLYIFANRNAKNVAKLAIHSTKGNFIRHLAEGKPHPSLEEIKKSKRLIIIGNIDRDRHDFDMGTEVIYIPNTGEGKSNSDKNYRILVREVTTHYRRKQYWVCLEDVAIIE